MVFDIEGAVKIFEDKAAELKKSLSLTERISNAATALPGTSSRLKEAIEKLSDSQEAGEKIQHELKIASKFRKIDGVKVNKSNTEDMLFRVKTVAEDLLADCRYCKANCPAKAT